MTTTRRAAEPTATASRPRLRARWRVLLDTAAVLTFAATGRASHDEALDVSGLLTTAGPFLAGLGAGWALLRWRRGLVPAGSLREGALLAAASLVGGMGLRAVLDQGTAPAFVVVATLVLLLLLPGWRLLARAVTRPRSGEVGHGATNRK